MLVSAEEAVERCLSILDRHPSGLFSDFDGTLSFIAPTPDSAQAFPGATEALDRLSSQLDQFAIVTGRGATDALGMIGLNHIRVVGNHGLETIHRGEHTVHAIGLAARSGIEQAMIAVASELGALTDTTGMVFENKVYSASIHFRNTNEPDVIETHLDPLVHRIAKENKLRVTGGKMMFELRPNEVVSKGTALAELIRKYSLHGAIFIGDDVTDVDGFDTLRELAVSEGVTTLAIGVMSEETPPSIVAKSDILLSGVEDTVRMLTLLADALESK